MDGGLPAPQGERTVEPSSLTGHTPSVAEAASLHDAISAQARRRPDGCALVFGGQPFSYRWLQDRADHLTRLLVEAGVRPGDVVGLFLERVPDMVAGVLAVLQAGAAYLPLDPQQPDARLLGIATDAGIAVLLSQDALDGRLADAPFARVRCEDVAQTGPAPFARPAVGPADLAYVLYTSGSTGRPKGVEITHGAVLNLIAFMRRETGFTERDCTLGSTTLAFDISVLELFLPLTTGGRLALADRAALSDPQALARLIDDAGCTLAHGTPAKWRYLLEAGWTGGADLAVMCGGEAMTRDLADRLLGCCRRLWNGYGPTETTVCSTLARIGAGTETPPIGRAIDNTTLHILDDAGRPAPDGEIGDLHIGGLGLARGYRNRPDLTRERFVQVEGERVYRSGDRVRRRPDGGLDYVGRSDDQVKIRGCRVELGEVEAGLLQCEGVAWAAAKTQAHDDGEVTLVAYVAAAAGQAPVDVARLRRALARILPDYMLPAHVVGLDALPLTPNGKVDRNALPPPVLDVEPDRRGLREPRGTQERLAAVWAGVLGLASVAPQDNFFDLGGYSLLTLKLLRRIESTFGRTLTMAQLFAAPDLAAMARLLDDPAPPAPLHIALQPEGARPPLIWFDVGPQLRGLAERLAPDQPFIGLNLDDVGPGERRLPAAEIGAQMVRLLKRYQPHGPYRLGGWCRWGVMAYAAALQLLDAGEEVPLLVLLDAVNAASPWQVLRRTRRRGVQALTRRVREPEPPMTGLGQVVETAARRYRPTAYRGDVLLLRSADTERDWDLCSGWRDVVRGRLQVCDLAGDHTGILKPPHVDALATALREGLAARP